MNKHNLKDSYYVKMEEVQRKSLIYTAKKRFRNWNQFAASLQVHRASIFQYLNGRSMIPYSSFKIICSFAKVKEQMVHFEKILKQNASIKYSDFAFDEQLAEIIGILLGDGSLYKELHRNRYHTTICFNKAEKGYLYYVKSLLESYFKHYKFYIAEALSEFLVRNVSNEVGTHLIKAGLNPGNKITNKIMIPSWITEDKKLLSRTLRGIFDTDGCVYRKYNHYAQIQFKFGCIETTESVREAFKKLGYHPTKMERYLNKANKVWAWKFYLSRQEEINNFFNEISPKNEKHIRRYNNIKNGAAGI